jgi:hypothetical protein
VWCSAKRQNLAAASNDRTIKRCAAIVRDTIGGESDAERIGDAQHYRPFRL